jgi:RNA polymerase sigma factor for flagellar operon FliA
VTPQTENITENVQDIENREHLKTVALRAYSSNTQKILDNDNIVQYLPMVKRIVQKVTTYIKPPLSYEDLVSAGTIGLIKAARDFDPSKQAQFDTYAYIRIKGAILDELRAFSILPPNLNKQIKNATEAGRKITEQNGSAPTDDELAKKLGITIEKLYETFINARTKHFVSIDAITQKYPALSDMLSDQNTANPDQQLEQTELIDKLADAIMQLDERKRQIIILYYQQNLTMKQIAGLFDITESRVSQMHASAIFNLSVKLRHLKNGRE